MNSFYQFHRYLHTITFPTTFNVKLQKFNRQLNFIIAFKALIKLIVYFCWCLSSPMTSTPEPPLINETDVCFTTIDDPATILLTENKYKKQTGNFWQSIPTCEPLQRNRYYKIRFKMIFLAERHLLWGIGDGNLNYGAIFLGQVARSVGFYCLNGYIYQNGVPQPFSSGCPQGQEIEVIIDMYDEGELWYRTGSNPFKMVWKGFNKVYSKPYFAFALDYNGDIVEVVGKKYFKK